MAALALIAGSLLGWLAAFVAVIFLDASLTKATFVFFATSLGFASSLLLLQQLAMFGSGSSDE